MATNCEHRVCPAVLWGVLVALLGAVGDVDEVTEPPDPG
jgi:hypothetical protein